MKANGRRRWRNSTKHWRERFRKDERTIRELSRNERVGRGIGVPRRDARGLPAIPAPPFSLRSLPGMTSGARKRAARRDASTASADGIFASRVPAVRRHFLAIFSFPTPEQSALYEVARRRLRIGQRLRPCSGCTGCEVCFEGPTCRWCREHPPLCDGSGVVPAKGRR